MLDQIKELIEQNKDNTEVLDYLKGVVKPDMTPEGVQEFLNSEEGKKVIQPKLDQYFTKGLETWKANNLPKIIDEKMKELNPEETPEQKKLRELEQKILDAENKAKMAELKSFATQKVTEAGLPTQLAEMLMGADEQTTEANISVLKQLFDAEVQKVVKEKLKTIGGDPGNNNNNNKNNRNTNPWAKETFNLTEQGKLIKQNPDLARQLMTQAGMKPNF